MHALYVEHGRAVNGYLRLMHMLIGHSNAIVLQTYVQSLVSHTTSQHPRNTPQHSNRGSASDTGARFAWQVDCMTLNRRGQFLKGNTGAIKYNWVIKDHSPAPGHALDAKTDTREVSANVVERAADMRTNGTRGEVGAQIPYFVLLSPLPHSLGVVLQMASRLLCARYMFNISVSRGRPVTPGILLFCGVLHMGKCIRGSVCNVVHSKAGSA